MDWRLLDVEEGVCSRCAGDLPGDRLWFKEPGSGVMEDTARAAGCCLEGGWKDFAFAVRVAFGSLGMPVKGLRRAESVSRRLPLFKEGARPSWEGGASPASLAISCRPSRLVVGIIPGPTLFRGARAAGFGGACAGNWLCRRVRMAMLVAGGGIEAASEATVDAEAVEAPLGFLLVDWLKRRMKELLRVGRESAGTPVNACMLGVLVLAGTVLLKVPGAGKSLRSGS